MPTWTRKMGIYFVMHVNENVFVIQVFKHSISCKLLAICFYVLIVFVLLEKRTCTAPHWKNRLNLGPNSRGCSPTSPRHFWAIFGTCHFFIGKPWQMPNTHEISETLPGRKTIRLYTNNAKYKNTRASPHCEFCRCDHLPIFHMMAFREQHVFYG